MPEILLSVLVCGIPGRWTSHTEGIPLVLSNLLDQASNKPVEVLYLLDNRKMSVGRKRNILLSIAQGRYFAFVDDDDSVAEDYITQLLEAIKRTAGDAIPPDVIVFDQLCTHVHEGIKENCRYGLGMEYRREPLNEKEFAWFGLPAHTQCWRTEAVNMVEFPDGNFGEDVSWVKEACKRAKTEYRIEGWTGYYYNFDSKRTATRNG